VPRANRYYLPGYIYHITHRCQKKDFLLKLRRDCKNWIKWLYESKKRYGLIVYNYIVTSNHIHLIVESPTDETLHNDKFKRETQWSKSIAIGDQYYVENFKKDLGVTGRSRKLVYGDDVCSLEKPSIDYGVEDNLSVWNVKDLSLPFYNENEACKV
jgi:REP element-mobilizing transposase RayT